MEDKDEKGDEEREKTGVNTTDKEKSEEEEKLEEAVTKDPKDILEGGA